MPLNINWQQILLHLFNFFLLLAILTHFVYEPVLDFINKRQKHFKDLEDEYASKNGQAQKLMEENKKIFENTDAEIKKYKSEKLEEVRRLTQDKINQANAQADNIIEEARKKADLEYNKILENANKDIRKMAIETTRKLLSASRDEFDDFVDHFQEGDDNNE
ncbi:MAG: ATP synthase F0 subunit B [Tissierellia bacterium]|nr:ATP synthase F0 subunit B [Tissierellia bacterium]